MEGRGGCCLVRYAGEADVASKVDRIMLRFRPIAPKPATSSSGRGSVLSTETCTKRRGARKEGRRGRKRRMGSDAGDQKVVAVGEPVTLPLMPETPERKEVQAPPTGDAVPTHLPPAMWRPAADGSFVVAPEPVHAAAGSWVTVECVTDTCVEVERLRSCSRDEEARRVLEEDVCPAFMSDEMERVTWTNEAYWRMVGEGGQGAVALVSRVKLPGERCRAFTCQVRVRYAGRAEKGSLTAPCDVWRLGDGGFLWMLDVTAALSLGR